MKHFYNLNIFSDSCKRNLKVMALSSLLLSGANSLVNAQTKAYAFAQSTGTFTAVTAGTVLATATGTSGTASLYQVTPYDVTLPFNFNYNGAVYSSIKVSSNGYITFGTTAPSTSNSTPISSAETYNGAVSVFGKSLNTFANLGGITGDIRTEVVGTAPNREMVIQWTNFRPAYGTSSTTAYAFSFQIRLKETSNVINMVYNSGAFAIGSTSVTGTAQIGLRGTTNSDYNNRLNASTLAFTSSTPGTANSSTQYTSTVSTSTSGMPPAGFTYTWTPPTCFVPTLTTSSSTANSITANWTAPTPAPSSYDVYYSTTNTAPTSTTPPTQPNITGTSTTISILPASTTYYVWVRSNCGSGSYSEWTEKPLIVTTLCQAPVLTTVTGVNFCPGQTATLSAASTTGAAINWYNSSIGGTSIATGTNYTTPALTSTTNYWVSASVGTNNHVGPVSPSTLLASAATTASSSYYIDFTVSNTATNLISVDVFPDSAGQSSTIEIYDGVSTSTLLYSIPFTSTLSSGGTIAQTIPVNLQLTPGSYRMKLIGGDYYRNYATAANGGGGASFPYTTNNFSITGGMNSATASYYFLYNLYVGNQCESARQQVTATLDATACLGTSETTAKETVKVHPNPFTEIINITKSELVKTVKVIDASGKLLRTINNPQASINLQDLSEGLYVLVLEMKDGSQQSTKVIKK